MTTPREPAGGPTSGQQCFCTASSAVRNHCGRQGVRLGLPAADDGEQGLIARHPRVGADAKPLDEPGAERGVVSAAVGVGDERGHDRPCPCRVRGDARGDRSAG
jgi:hypothetical protein